MGRLSLGSWLYLAAIVGVAGGIMLIAPISTADTKWWACYAVLALLFLICDSTPTPLAARQSAWSPSSAATLAAVVLLHGGIGAAMVGAAAVLTMRRQVLFYERLFNGAMYAVAGYAAGVAYLAVSGQPHPFMPDLLRVTEINSSHGLPPTMFEALLWPFAVAALAHVLVNHGLLWGMLLLDRRSAAATRRGDSPAALPLLLAYDIGFAGLGLVIAALWPVMQYFAATIVLVPLYVARWAMGQFAEQQRAHSATLAALCQAVETKDFYTRGHSDRVSRGAGMIARQIKMPPSRIEAVRFAGMLHDVGKLGVPTKVLQKEGALTEEEYAAIQLHPMRGLEIVGEIGFLNEALTGIMHHHERMDGRGYPMGFAGDEIPQFAKIIAVADAFDSMTSTRSYRVARRNDEAVAELRKSAGSQFDPKIVEAFISALDREGWKGQELAQPREYEILTSQDHDDPISPLRVVESR
ncbi:MAG TPA: HD-GYP domain-containing protein [Streptosporangiaceae bacterium]|nr:HD-GYP domain-containing protein [Streptosporangiaceae bacterium]